MIKRFSGFLMGLVLGGALVFVGLKYHVLMASDGLHMIPKMSAEFGESYVDIRQFTLDDWNEHRTLAAAIVRSGRGDLLGDSADQALRTTLDGALEALNQSS